MTTDLSWAALPLPDDVAQMKAAGFLDDCRAAIHTHLQDDALPACLRHRLELELERLPFLPEEEYPYGDADALRLLDETFTDFRPEELPDLVNARAADWIYVRGVRRFHHRFLANIITTRPDYAARQKRPSQASREDAQRARRLEENLDLMAQKGRRSARITLRATFRLRPQAVRPGVPLTVHLPIPRACAHQSDIRILALSHPDAAVLAPEDAPQRTVCFRDCPAGDAFSVTYSYVNTLSYVRPDPALAQAGYPDSCRAYLAQQAPNILFTPLMHALLEGVRGEERNPLQVARRIYDFVTQQVKYSYMREYAALDCICDYAARNRKGDCGVQAILFITLCRLAGIPARWQSGLCADPDHVGCHDWAEFYVRPYGWLYADPSYGGGAWRARNLRKWNYYFGNLDVYRMVSCGETQSPFQPPKRFFRIDPTDNQRGEAEYPDRGLLPGEVEHHEEMLDFQELDG